MPIQVAVCGPSDAGAELSRQAHEVGRLLAQRSAVVICGGYSGVMGAVAAGARSAGGMVIGVLSGADRSGAAPGLSAVLPTGMGQARNNIIVNAADAVIVIGSSWGSVSELALAKRRGGIPVVQLGGWRIYDADGRPVEGIGHADDPEDAVRQALGSPVHLPATGPNGLR
ncbi:LOG family protein [Allonocardiopsis opalescens]|uniref:TIGR00725 family protein n=1 Tax=Allonocardiopsis opalescens TaxID=1144618 RepID=A0A2T0Q033_9ACTN|nr:LOG family protein [Allonocardiopsis opalescens]PRX97147.1 hypothetical protein CLV72_106183 [Allonocardiopsis opalescens]